MQDSRIQKNAQGVNEPVYCNKGHEFSALAMRNAKFMWSTENSNLFLLPVTSPGILVWIVARVCCKKQPVLGRLTQFAEIKSPRSSFRVRTYHRTKLCSNAVVAAC